MKHIKMILCMVLALTLFAGCTSGIAPKTPEALADETVFLAAYNEAAEGIGANPIAAGNVGPYVLNGEEQESGFIVSDGLEANMLAFGDGQIMLVGRPNDFRAFLLETQAVMMAAMGLSAEEAGEEVYAFYYEEDAGVRETAGSDVVEKAITHNGVTMRGSQSNGIYSIVFTAV